MAPQRQLPLSTYLPLFAGNTPVCHVLLGQFHGTQRCMTMFVYFLSVNMGNVCTSMIRVNRRRVQVMHIGIRKYRQATDTTRKPRSATRQCNPLPPLPPPSLPCAQWSVMTSRETCLKDREASEREREVSWRLPCRTRTYRCICAKQRILQTLAR